MVTQVADESFSIPEVDGAYYGRMGTLRCVVPGKRLEIRAGEISKGLRVKNELVKLADKYLGKID